MTIEDKIRALRGVPSLADRTDAELEDLANRAEEAIAAPGDVLAREGHAGRATSIVLTGEATVARNGGVVDKAGPGAVLGDPDHPPATVTAVTLMHLLVLDADAFERDESAAGERAS
jgi:CRP-like cAMP-binding protein